MEVVEALKGLSPDAQLVLAMCIFAMVMGSILIVFKIISSPTAARNFFVVVKAIASLFTHKRKPPQGQPT